MKKQNGNALWFILIAVGLLGLLTVTLTRSGSSTNETGSFEQNQIVASQILTYAKSIENAVQSLLARGCSENEISFENNIVAGYVNPNSPTDNSCHVFDAAGAGMTYEDPKEKWLDNAQSGINHYQTYLFSGTSCVLDVGEEGINCHTDASIREELILFLPYVTRSICISLNKSLNMPNPGGEPEQETGGAWRPIITDAQFNGIYEDGNQISIPGSVYQGQSSYCFEGDTLPAAGTYHFYHVLHAR